MKAFCKSLTYKILLYNINSYISENRIFIDFNINLTFSLLYTGINNKVINNFCRKT